MELKHFIKTFEKAPLKTFYFTLLYRSLVIRSLSNSPLLSYRCTDRVDPCRCQALIITMAQTSSAIIPTMYCLSQLPTLFVTIVWQFNWYLIISLFYHLNLTVIQFNFHNTTFKFFYGINIRLVFVIGWISLGRGTTLCLKTYIDFSINQQKS